MKVCVVCNNFNLSAIRKQPWKYVYEISTRLSKHNFQVVLISNNAICKAFERITIRYAKRIRPIFLFNDAPLLQVLRNENPDAVLWLAGPSSFIYLTWLKRSKFRNFLLLTGPFYSMKDIFQLGPKNVISFLPHIWTNLIGTFIPKVLVRTLLNAPYVHGAIVLSKRNKIILDKVGVNQRKVFLIPPGIDESYCAKVSDHEELKKTRKNLNIASEDFVLLFLGPATKLRGADTLVKSIALTHKRLPSLKAIILARRLSDPFAEKEESEILSLIAKLKLGHIIRVVKGVFPQEDVKKFIEASDVIVLPFRLVQSDVPISLLEALALGKPVISTDVDGIPEWLDGRSGVLLRSAQPLELAQALVMFHSNRSSTKKTVALKRDHPLLTWDAVVLKIAEVIRSVAAQCP